MSEAVNRKRVTIDVVRELLKTHSIEDICWSLQQIDRDEFEGALEGFGYVEEDNVSYVLSGEDEDRVREADEIVAALRDAENFMIAGRRDDARHLLYMAMPSGARDIFHPTQGLKA